MLTLLFATIHFTQDVIHQAEGANRYPIPVVIIAVSLYGTCMLSNRISGYVIMLFGGLIGIATLIIHSKGIVVNKSGGFFFIWTLLALSATGWFTATLSARGIWTTLRSGRRTLRAGDATQDVRRKDGADVVLYSNDAACLTARGS